MKFGEFIKRFDDNPFGFFEAFAPGSVTEAELQKIETGEYGFCVLKEKWEQRPDGDYRTILKAKTIPTGGRK